jgi:hypothetical protein
MAVCYILRREYATTTSSHREQPPRHGGARAEQQQNVGWARPRWSSTRSSALPEPVVRGRWPTPAVAERARQRTSGGLSLPGMADALESGEPSAVSAFEQARA